MLNGSNLLRRFIYI